MAIPTMTVMFFSVLAIWVVGNVDSATPHVAPAPGVDCSSVVLSMTDCLSYVTNGSTVETPEGTCCSGLKTVLKTSPECLCEVYKNSAQLGISLNLTKAAGLPKACHVSASVSQCETSPPTAAVRATPPAAAAGGAVSPSTSVPPTPAAGKKKLAPAPAPAPMKSGSAKLAISVGSLIAALVAASLSLI